MCCVFDQARLRGIRARRFAYEHKRDLAAARIQACHRMRVLWQYYMSMVRILYESNTQIIVQACALVVYTASMCRGGVVFTAFGLS